MAFLYEERERESKRNNENVRNRLGKGRFREIRERKRELRRLRKLKYFAFSFLTGGERKLVF